MKLKLLWPSAATLALLLCFLLLCQAVEAQQFVFAELTGNPTMNTSGWNLNGNAQIGDTPGDADGNPNEMILTPPINSTSGACFYNTALDLSLCNRWVAEFDYRIWDGNGADGIAFCFLMNPPNGFVIGGSIGIPSNVQGFVVALDQYDNGCGQNPEVQLFYSNGGSYSECGVNARRTGVALVRQPNYNRCKVEYINGNINVYLNNVLQISGFYQANFSGFLGFTSSTGGARDRHSIRDVIIYTDMPLADAGADATICSGESVMIGSLARPNHSYSWSPTTGLSDPNIAMPDFSISNTSGSPVNYTFTVTVDSAGVGCTSTDEVTITVEPGQPFPNNHGCDIQLIRQTMLNAGGTDITGCNIDCSMYFYFPTAMTGNQAQAFAESYGANLVSIASAQENAQVINGLNNNGFGGVIWIGFNDIVQEGTFEWFDQSPITYTNWAPGEPNQAGNEDCTQIYPGGQWNDLSCTSSNSRFVVEVSLCPILSITPPLTVCEGSSATLSASTILGSAPYTYLWSDGQTGSTITVTPTANTTYSVTATDRYNCTIENSTMISVYVSNADAGVDVDICEGENTQLAASGGYSYSWTPTTGLSNPNIANPMASPTTTTTYTVEVVERIGNQVGNGDFSGGNVAFSSSYTYSTNLYPEGTYWVGTNARQVHNGFSPVTDHTTGSGNYMVVNGSGSPGTNVWCQTINVDPNTEYDFSTWVTSVAVGSPAVLQFSLNGSNLGSPFTAPSTPGVWQEFTANWNSGNNTSVTICIVNQNTSTGGNDFGIDDIAFSPLCRQTDDVVVTVSPLPVADAGADQAICIGDSVTINAASVNGTYSWSTGDTTQTIRQLPPNSTNYSLTVVTGPNCSATDQVNVTVNSLPTANAGADQSICLFDTATLTASGGTVYNWSTGENTASIRVAPVTQTNYSVTVTDANNCSAVDDIEVSIFQRPSIQFTADPVFVCLNEQIQINSTGTSQAGIASYQWSGAGSGSLDNLGIPNPMFDANGLVPSSNYGLNLVVTDMNSCSMIDSMAVTINPLPPAYAGEDDTICIGQSAQISASGGTGYLWSTGSASQNISVNPGASSYYELTVTDANQCSATDTVHILVNPLPIVDAGVDQSICRDDSASLTASGGIAYSWSSGQNVADITVSPANQTTYTVTATDANSCSATDAVDVIIFQRPAIQFASDPVFVCLNEQIQINSLGTSPAPIASYQWSGAGSGNLDNLGIPNPMFDANGLVPSSNYGLALLVTDMNSCSMIDSIVVTVNPLPPADAGADDTICIGQNTQLSASGGTGYQWSTSSGTQTILVNPSTSTTYAVTVTDGNQCSASDAVFVLVNPRPIADAGPDQNICPGDTAMLTASGGIGYEWSTGELQDQIQVSPAQSSSYSVTVTDQNQCSLSDQMQLTIYPQTEAIISPNPAELCAGTQTGIQLRSGHGVSLITASWQGDDNHLNNLNSLNPIFNSLGIRSDSSFIYSLVATDANGCTDSNNLVVNVHELPVADAGLDTNSCAFEDVRIGGSPTGTQGGGAYGYSWSPAFGINDIEQSNPTINSASSTTYSVTVTDQFGCSSTDQVAVEIFANPRVNFDDTVVCPGTPLILSYPGYASYQWSSGGTESSDTVVPEFTSIYSLTVTDFNGCTGHGSMDVFMDQIFVDIFADPGTSLNWGDEVQLTTTIIDSAIYSWHPSEWLNDPMISDPIALPDRDVTYSVHVESPEGCVTSASITLEVNIPPGEMVVPSAFTPNGDGQNDEIGPISLSPQAELIDFIITNRWGDVLFQSSSETEKWDGMYKDQEQPMANYVYFLRYKNGKEPVQFSGNLILLR